MTQDIKEAMKQWEHEKLLKRKLRKQDNLLAELQKELKELKEGLVKPPPLEETPPPVEEVPPIAPPLEIETDLTDEVQKSGLSKFWDNLKAPGREGRAYRKEKRQGKPQNPSQKQPPENPQ